MTTNQNPAGTGSRGAKLDPPGQANKGFLLAVGAILVLGIAAVAFVASTRGGDETSSGTDSAGAQTASVQIDGDTLATLPEGLTISDLDTDPVAGQVAPTLTATTFDGGEVTIGADGSPKAIYFLAHWCPHCQAEVPLVQELIDDGKAPAGLEIYGVSTAVNSGQGNYPPSDWLGSEGFTPTVVRDDEDSSAFSAFGGGGFPYVVYLDGENRVVARSSGSLDADTIQRLWQLAAPAG